MSCLPDKDGTETADRSRTSLETMIRSADDGIVAKRNEIVAKIGEKVIRLVAPQNVINYDEACR